MHRWSCLPPGCSPLGGQRGQPGRTTGESGRATGPPPPAGARADSRGPCAHGNTRVIAASRPRTWPQVMADTFDAYAPAVAWDEMFERPGEVRTICEPVRAALRQIGPGELRSRADQMARGFTDRGTTYAFAGEERPRPLDLAPRILAAHGISYKEASLSGSEPWRPASPTPTGPATPFEDRVVPEGCRTRNAPARVHRCAVTDPAASVGDRPPSGRTPLRAA